MNQVKTDWRLLALITGVGGFLLGLTAWQDRTSGKLSSSFDSLVLWSIAGGLLFGASFLCGHLVIRNMARRRAVLYVLMGACTSLVAFLGIGGLSLLKVAAEQQLVSLAIGLPLLIGGMLGYTYYSGAGVAGDDPDRITAIEAAVEGKEGSAPMLISAGEEEYYSGPMQVRFSLSLMLVAGALLGALLAGFVIVISLTTSLADSKLRGWSPGESVAIAVTMTLGLGLLMVIPTMIGHYAANYLKARTAGSYVGYGFLANVALGLVTGVFLVAAPFAAGSLALYRRLAGMEPVGLPEDIRVRDRRALVGANHPARRYHRVIDESDARRNADAK